MIDFDAQLESVNIPADTALDEVMEAMLRDESDPVDVHVDAMLAQNAADVRATMDHADCESRRFRAG